MAGRFDRSEGKIYAEAARWRLKTPIPPAVASMTVSQASPKARQKNYLRRP